MKRVLVIFSLALSGCVGPLVSQESARTVGRHNSEIIGGGGQAGWMVKYTFGLTENLDIAAQTEELSVGARIKYAFVNNQEEGWSAAIAGGAGSSIGGEHYYGDLMGSYLFGVMEPYATFRYVHVSIDATDFKDNDNGQTLFTIPGGSYNYGQAILGTRVWFTKHWLMSAEAASLISLTSGLKFSNDVIVDGAFGYRF